MNNQENENYQNNNKPNNKAMVTSNHQMGSVRTKFTDIEDIKLVNIVMKMKKINWKQVSSLMGNKTPRQCRERYNNYLSPKVQNKTWTDEEDKLLLEKYSIYGPQWSFLTQFFKNRAAVNIKNHYTKLSAHQKKDQQKEKIEKQNEEYDHIEDAMFLNSTQWPEDFFEAFYDFISEGENFQTENLCEFC